MTTTTNLPAVVYVYQIDEDVGKPVYAVVTDLDDVLDGTDIVGVYEMTQRKGFRVRREVYDL